MKTIAITLFLLSSNLLLYGQTILVSCTKYTVLRHLYLELNSDFLVTFEVVKDLGSGRLCFPASILHRTYVRETSQGRWETAPVGISISVLVDVER